MKSLLELLKEQLGKSWTSSCRTRPSSCRTGTSS